MFFYFATEQPDEIEVMHQNKVVAFDAAIET